MKSSRIPQDMTAQRTSLPDIAIHDVAGNAIPWEKQEAIASWLLERAYKMAHGEL